MKKFIKFLLFVIAFFLFCSHPVLAAGELEPPNDFSGAWFETDTDQYTVFLNWNANNDYYQDGIDLYYSNYGYIVYRDNQEVYRLEPSDSNNGDIDYINSYNLNNGGIIFDSSVKKGATYKYSVVAFDHYGNTSNPVELEVAINPEEKCDDELQLEGQETGEKQSISLKWNKYCDDNVEYRILRDGQLIDTIDPESIDNYMVDDGTMEYLDETVPSATIDKEYDYRIEVWDYKSSLSSIIFTRVFAEESAPRAVADIKIKVSANKSDNDTNFNNMDEPDLPTWGLTWERILQNIYSIIAFLVGSALVIMFLLGGVMYITSAGDEEKAKKAAKTVTAAVIGFIITIMAYGIITFVAQLK